MTRPRWIPDMLICSTKLPLQTDKCVPTNYILYRTTSLEETKALPLIFRGLLYFEIIFPEVRLLLNPSKPEGPKRTKVCYGQNKNGVGMALNVATLAIDPLDIVS